MYHVLYQNICGPNNRWTALYYLHVPCWRNARMASLVPGAPWWWEQDISISSPTNTFAWDILMRISDPCLNIDKGLRLRIWKHALNSTWYQVPIPSHSQFRWSETHTSECSAVTSKKGTMHCSHLSVCDHGLAFELLEQAWGRILKTLYSLTLTYCGALDCSVKSLPHYSMMNVLFKVKSLFCQVSLLFKVAYEESCSTFQGQGIRVSSRIREQRPGLASRSAQHFNVIWGLSTSEHQRSRHCTPFLYFH